jgi:hypothetical protein
VLHGLLGIVSPWTLAALVASAIAFYSSARSLQIGPAIEVITMTSVAANVAAIVGGVIVFHDSLGSGGLGIVERVAAFALVVGGAALMPAPVKSAGATDATCDPSAGAPGAAPQARA